MQAIYQDKYGPVTEVLRVAEVPKPTPGQGEVVVEVHAASLNAADWRVSKGEPLVLRLMMGLRSPKDPIPGSDFAGRIVAVGAEAGDFAVGDDVFGCTSEVGQGACAEFVRVPATNLVIKPAAVSFETAAATPLAALTALQALRKAEVGPGQQVMVLGASGGVGSFAVQIAAHLGAVVTGVCSTSKVELVKELGATHVLDYSETDPLAIGPKMDVVIHVGGTYNASAIRAALKPKGTAMLVGGEGGGKWFGPIGRFVRGLAQSPFVSQRIVTINAQVTTEYLNTLAELLVEGSMRPLISKTVSLAEVPVAMGELEQGHTTGKIVVNLQA